MAHEQSETLQRNGQWVNIHGRNTLNAGQPLPLRFPFERRAYPTSQSAAAAAMHRSAATDPRTDMPIRPELLDLIAGPEPAPRDPMRDAVIKTAPPTGSDAIRWLRGFLTRGHGALGGPQDPRLTRPAELAGRQAGTGTEQALGLATLFGTPRALFTMTRAMPPRIINALDRHPRAVGIAEPLSEQDMLKLLRQLYGLPPGLKAGALTTIPAYRFPHHVPNTAVSIVPTKEQAGDPRMWAHEALHALNYLKHAGNPAVPDPFNFPPQYTIRIVPPMARRLGALTPDAVRMYLDQPAHWATDLAAQNAVRRAGMPYASLYGEPTTSPAQIINRAHPAVTFKGTSEPVPGKVFHWYDVDVPGGVKTTGGILDSDLQAGKLAQQLRETFRQWGMTP